MREHPVLVVLVVMVRQDIWIMRLRLPHGKVWEWVLVAVVAWQVATLLPVGDVRPEEWCRRRAPFAALATEQGSQLVDLVLARQVLREQVRWVVRNG